MDQGFTELDKALNNHFEGAIISSPTKFHVEQTIQCLNKGWPALLEKPVGLNLKSVNKLIIRTNQKDSPKVLLGYTWRWWEALKKIKELLLKNEIGSIYHSQFFMSAHLADWHPWEPYQEFFMSSKELGGGALLDESHWIDQMIWFFGMPEKIASTVDKVSDLDITSDDSVELIACYKEKLKVIIHLDIYGRPHEKSIKIIGEYGRIEWNESSNTVDLMKGLEKKESFEFDNERNDMFMAVAKEFLDVINGVEFLTCNIKDGLDVMRVIEAVRISKKEERFVNLSEIYY